MKSGSLKLLEVSLVRNIKSFFFQAEDGIRDYKVTGVQTCALPICHRDRVVRDDQKSCVCAAAHLIQQVTESGHVGIVQIGRASCRERV